MAMKQQVMAQGLVAQEDKEKGLPRIIPGFDRQSEQTDRRAVRCIHRGVSFRGKGGWLLSSEFVQEQLENFLHGGGDTRKRREGR